MEQVIEYIKQSCRLFFFKKDAFKYIDKKVDWVMAVIVAFVFTMFFSFVEFHTAEDLIVESLLEFFILAIVSFFGDILVLYGLLHLFLKLFKGKGKFIDAVKHGLSLWVFPSLLAIVVGIVAVLYYSLFGFGKFLPLEVILIFLIFVLVISILIWTIIVFFDVFSKIYKVSKLKVLFAVLCIMGISLLIFMGLVIFTFSY